ncbi:MAG TPA: hypothetical protein VFW65_17020 [Pseudonocardiaceae bacterium]|nr:hypothetical protein [Pseudonocardiaceae bacterium]
MTTRPSAGSRRAGYAIAALVNVALLVLIHWWPTWRAVPFLTEATVDVLAPVTVVLVLSIATSVAYLAYDRAWFVALGRTVTGLAGVAVTVRILRVFPFDFGEATTWATLVRIALIVALLGGALGVLAQLVVLVRGNRGR